jgi:hypothetical protein
MGSGYGHNIHVMDECSAALTGATYLNRGRYYAKSAPEHSRRHAICAFEHPLRWNSRAQVLARPGIVNGVPARGRRGAVAGRLRSVYHRRPAEPSR